jgi:hypothetical protein
MTENTPLPPLSSKGREGGEEVVPKTRSKKPMVYTHEENLELMGSNRGAFLLGKAMMRLLNDLVSVPLELREDQEIKDLGRLLAVLPNQCVSAAALTCLVYDITHDRDGTPIGPAGEDDDGPHAAYTELMGIIDKDGGWRINTKDAKHLGDEVFKAASEYAKNDKEYADHLENHVLNKGGVESLEELLNGDE